METLLIAGGILDLAIFTFFIVRLNRLESAIRAFYEMHGVQSEWNAEITKAVLELDKKVF